MTRRISAVGFDFGYTLVRPVREPVDCLLGALPEAGPVMVPVEAVAAHQPDPATVQARLAAAQDGRQWDETLRAWYRVWALACGSPAGRADQVARAAAARHQSPSNWVACAGADEVLDACRHRGLPVGILSTWGPGLAAVIDARGWRDRVQVAIASSLTGLAKPRPAAFAQLCAALDASPAEVLFAGDDPDVDHDGAASYGMAAVVIGAAAGGRRGVPSLQRLAELILRNAIAAW